MAGPRIRRRTFDFHAEAHGYLAHGLTGGSLEDAPFFALEWGLRTFGRAVELIRTEIEARDEDYMEELSSGEIEPS